MDGLRRDALVAYAKSTPAATRATAALLAAAFVLLPLRASSACLLPWRVLGRLEVWRLVTAPLAHASLLHLALNLLAFVPLGSHLERGMGTVRFSHVLLVLMALQAAIHLALACALAMLGLRGALRSCAVGFSGAVFALMAVDNAAARGATRSLLGRVELPAPLLPWLTLAAVQVLVPRASLLGHLAGLLAGEAWAAGLLPGAWLGDAALAQAEGSPAYSAAAARIGGCVAGTPGAVPVWRELRDGIGGGSGGGGLGSNSSVAAAWALAARGGAAAWARLPPQSRESVLRAWAHARLAAVRAWQQLAAAAPPGVAAAGAAARGAVAEFLAAHAPPRLVALCTPRRSGDGGGVGEDELEEVVSGEGEPLLPRPAAPAGSEGGGEGGAVGAATAAATAVTAPSPARRARPSQPPPSPFASQ
ncbi:hypothetical protein Rsub_05035 [Raphidocelis subcapitata]|uniref:Peptidase S54 rhomboid domain-containing protein n=1 Tax=Raphidocelis subcapitata TaxID=307507 RepID=A0A2V0NYH3_9CHLO|nr:hypothetical protein Rsub_05035 [Raphidocelis subcapitata]|eukprot:GBF92666.1 hypothetical protein Rsub_05035 [Raphidocelis subcapitata]